MARFIYATIIMYNLWVGMARFRNEIILLYGGQGEVSQCNDILNMIYGWVRQMFLNVIIITE